MSRETSVIVLGLFIVVIPFLGIPSSWRTVVLILCGLCIAVLGFLLRSRSLEGGIARRGSPFMQNGHGDENEKTTQEPAEHRAPQL